MADDLFALLGLSGLQGSSQLLGSIGQALSTQRQSAQRHLQGQLQGQLGSQYAGYPYGYAGLLGDMRGLLQNPQAAMNAAPPEPEWERDPTGAVAERVQWDRQFCRETGHLPDFSPLAQESSRTLPPGSTTGA